MPPYTGSQGVFGVLLPVYPPHGIFASVKRKEVQVDTDYIKSQHQAARRMFYGNGD
jgi:hypothetical protein